MPKFTFIKLIKENKVVPMRLLPDNFNNQDSTTLTWQIDDTDVLEYDSETKQFSLEVYEFIDDDYKLVKTLGHEDAKAVALADGIIYN